MKVTIRRPRRVLAAVIAAAAALVAPLVAAPPALAAVTCNNYSSSTSTCVNESISIGGTSYSTDWYFPNGTATALMLVEHGFSRGCGNLRGTSKSIAEQGLMVVCVNADMTGGNAALADTLGAALSARTLTPPNGKALPQKYIVGGHSAGGHFASAVGAKLNADGYANFKGAILFDPVASDGFTANLQAISQNGARPVLAVAARPSVINLFNNSFGALADLGADFVGIQLVWTKYVLGSPSGGSCHIDVEGENTDVIGVAGALCSPNSTQTARLRGMASTWAKDLATGSYTATHYCTDSDDLSTCGSYVNTFLAPSGSLPYAAVIPNS
ncbi:alpha/beta hydrolase family protein [Actinocorallia herbida]|uniref:Alpha/beta hydrolase family protein n=1 Tax=Actinocorallia herbida TaxID=58109 RepID=A0A3N1CV30_9ACTN|nr:alpha/beta hydrolase fold domain-containing protein [Actinocorallia herbida]ROO85146.1 alpha/beta hydrolase family protein [Actinocorallia herbida]